MGSRRWIEIGLKLDRNWIGLRSGVAFANKFDVGMAFFCDEKPSLTFHCEKDLTSVLLIVNVMVFFKLVLTCSGSKLKRYLKMFCGL